MSFGLPVLKMAWCWTVKAERGFAGLPSGLKYVQPDGRAIVRRKRSVDYRRGAAVFIGERLQKRLIKAGWPAVYVLCGLDVDGAESVVFRLRSGPVTPKFLAVLERLVAVESRRWRVAIVCEGCRVQIVGPHRLDVRFYWTGKRKIAVPRLRPLPRLVGPVPF